VAAERLLARDVLAKRPCVGKREQKLNDNHHTIKDMGHHEWCAHAKPAFREEHPSTGTNMARGPGVLLQLLAGEASMHSKQLGRDRKTRLRSKCGQSPPRQVWAGAGEQRGVARAKPKTTTCM
jgi:hypothetical protein